MGAGQLDLLIDLRRQNMISEDSKIKSQRLARGLLRTFNARMKVFLLLPINVTYENCKITLREVEYSKSGFVCRAARRKKRKARVIRVQRMLRISHAA